MRVASSAVLSLAAAVIAGATVGCGDAHPEPSTTDAAVRAPQLAFPTQFWTPCQSEVCFPGIWEACERLAVRETPSANDDPARWIEAGDTFRVDGANTVVLRPGLVRVTDDTEQRHRGGFREVYRAGDTIQVLDDRGEGFFTVWYDGGLVLTERFWPLQRAGRPEYTGELIQEPEQERWLRVETDRRDARVASGGLRADARPRGRPLPPLLSRRSQV